MKLKPYPEYEDSGAEWIGEIPKKWNCSKIKHITDVKISNVDKKSKSSEPDVLLCNYTDVYNNEFIVHNLDFMKATASLEQINKLSLIKGDVIITKDSETADDIAVPALVSEDLNNVVCGYHLALIRPNDEIKGDYLFRLLESKQINDQFSIAANGVTRFGISTYPIKNSYLMLPSKKEQIKITNFLDKKTSEIDLMIEKDTQLIELLKEKRTAMINHVVTKGLDPTVKMKDSGVEWIGEIPENWNIRKLSHIADSIVVGFVGSIESFYTDKKNGIPLLRTGNVGFGTLNLENLQYITPDFHLKNKKSQLKPGDIVIARHGESGRSCVIPLFLKDANCLNIVVLKSGKEMDGNYYSYVLNSHIIQERLQAIQGGAVQGVVNTEDISFLKVFHPPLDQQKEITKYLEKKTLKIDKTKRKIQDKIDLLEEYKKSLIQHVVTGKVDVREVTV